MPDLVELSVAIGRNRAAFFMDALDGRDHVVAQCIQHGLTYYELPLPTVMMALAEEAQGAFLDVGANTGLYALLATAANSNLTCYGFEPVPDVRSLMQNNLDANPELTKRISLLPYALSNTARRGVINQHVNPVGLVPTSSSLESWDLQGIDSVEVPIEITTLDIWARDAGLLRADAAAPGSISFIKIDVEGHEHECFVGGEQVLAKDRPIIIVELLGEAHFSYFNDFLLKNDFVDIALFPGQARLLKTPKFEADAWNHVFCPSEKVWNFARTCQRIGLPLA